MRRLFCIVILLVSVPALATVCAGPMTVCSSYGSNSIVFRGRVIELIRHPAPGTPVTYPDGSTDTLYTLPAPEDVRFEVLEVFKGEPGHEITIAADAGRFHQGDEYIIFGSPNPSTQALQTGVCTGNRAVEDAEHDADLAWLRAYPTAPPSVRIFGSVRMRDGVTDIPAISVKLAGPVDRIASTGEDHTYTFNDLPPGSYTVTAVLPTGYTTLAGDAINLTVGAKSCAEVDWSVGHDTHIRGTVTDEEGRPAAKALVHLLRTAQTRTGLQSVAMQETDAAGSYDFSKVDPGDYWVALHYLGPNNNDPHVPVYYPSGSSGSAAGLIHLGATETRDGVNIVATPALRTVGLRVRVVNSDGTPAVNAHVVAEDPLTPGQAIAATADADGDGEITLYEGRGYSLIANTNGNREPACAGPVKLVAKEGLQLGTLTLDKTFNECRTLQRAK
jgi:hypothetical protein